MPLSNERINRAIAYRFLLSSEQIFWWFTFDEIEFEQTLFPSNLNEQNTFEYSLISIYHLTNYHNWEKISMWREKQIDKLFTPFQMKTMASELIRAMKNWEHTVSLPFFDLRFGRLFRIFQKLYLKSMGLNINVRGHSSRFRLS